MRGILQVFHGRNRLPAALALLLTLPVGGLTAAPAAPDATAKTDAIEVEDRKLLAAALRPVYTAASGKVSATAAATCSSSTRANWAAWWTAPTAS